MKTINQMPLFFVLIQAREIKNNQYGSFLPATNSPAGLQSLGHSLSKYNVG